MAKADRVAVARVRRGCGDWYWPCPLANEAIDGAEGGEPDAGQAPFMGDAHALWDRSRAHGALRSFEGPNPL